MGNFKGTVTRNSNGSVEITPFDNANPPKDLAMGSEVDVTFEVTRSAEDIELANSKAKNRPAPAPAATSLPATGESETQRTGRTATKTARAHA